ncbi:hypothetical protein HU200_054004 [Digitaria exilis]|uniref:Uncharacterized protein n=1 Tax=Digitaria exilis TaxID=1010633 RepID=A0A835E2W3_9POAL|nr:hypothetical protein HU200_054004 [Digitaria exilis]
MDELFDTELFGDESQLMEITRCLEIALLCTQFDPADRPHMEDVLQMLHGQKELPIPKKPSYMDHDWICRPGAPSTLSDVSLSPR